MGRQKETRVIIRELRAQGFRVEHLDGGHYKVFPHDKAMEPVFFGLGSHTSGITNSVARLKRMGYVEGAMEPSSNGRRPRTALATLGDIMVLRGAVNVERVEEKAFTSVPTPTPTPREPKILESSEAMNHPAPEDRPAPEIFGEALRRLRKEAGLSQEALGQVCEVSGTAICGAEDGSRPVSERLYVNFLNSFPDLRNTPPPQLIKGQQKRRRRNEPAQSSAGGDPPASAENPLAPDDIGAVETLWEVGKATGSVGTITVCKNPAGKWAVTILTKDEAARDRSGIGDSVREAVADLLVLLGQRLEQERQDLERRMIEASRLAGLASRIRK